MKDKYLLTYEKISPFGHPANNLETVVEKGSLEYIAGRFDDLCQEPNVFNLTLAYISLVKKNSVSEIEEIGN